MVAQQPLYHTRPPLCNSLTAEKVVLDHRRPRAIGPDAAAHGVELAVVGHALVDVGLERQIARSHQGLPFAPG
jgi:hypothetical protein